ncbi:MAG: hypothetical protein HY557_08455 [Euryarchaeota archaeon]|nr:hypothetical protein [Euryarchaeota archaeon]
MATAFAVSYPLLFEGLPDDTHLSGLPFRGEAILLALAIAVGPWGTAGIVAGAAALRLLGTDALPTTFALAEALTFTISLTLAQRVWRHAHFPANAFAAPAVLTASIVVGLGTYWTLAMSRPLYAILFLQAFLAINVVGVGALLLWSMHESGARRLPRREEPLRSGGLP